ATQSSSLLGGQLLEGGRLAVDAFAQLDHGGGVVDEGVHQRRVEGAAALLGAHPETIRLKARAGQLPGRKVGKRWIFSTLALQRYLAGEWLPRETPAAPVNVTVTS
ncbi:helix-turn-helix domain-containing protein, partial [Streptococcus pyogenes]